MGAERGIFPLSCNFLLHDEMLQSTHAGLQLQFSKIVIFSCGGERSLEIFSGLLLRDLRVPAVKLSRRKGVLP